MKSIILPLLMLFSITIFSQSSNMSLLSNWAPDSIPQYNDIWGYMDCDGGEYALLGSKFKIHILNLADPANPAEVANFAGGEGSTWRDIKTYRNRAYAISDNTNEGLMILDLSNLPQAVTKTYHDNNLFANAHNLFVDEPNGRMYVVGSSVGNMLIYDVATDPDNPVLLENVNLEGGYVHDLYVRDNVAYCAHLGAGMYVYDCKDPQDVMVLGSVTDYNGTVFNHSNWLSEDGNTLIFCDETHGAPVKIANVSDFSDITVPAEQMFRSMLEAPAATNSIAHNPLIRDGYAFISYYHDGVQVYDINNPDSIFRVAYFDTNTDNTNYNGYQGCWGVYPFLSSGTIIASDITKGLFVLSMDALDLEPTINELYPDANIQVVNGPAVCQGDSSILSVPFENGNTYTWTKDEVLLPITGNSISVLSPGSYEVEVFNGMCNSFSTAVNITLKESPDLVEMTGDQAELCLDDNYTITAPADLDVYLWMQDGNVLANSSNTIQVVESGVYTLLTFKNGCSTFSAPYEITVNEIPEPEISLVQQAACEGQEVQLQSSPGADQYTWYKNGNLMAFTEDAFLTVQDEGEYTVILSTSDCNKTSDIFTFEFTPLPNNDISLSGSSTICEGDSVVLSANEDAASWEWTLNGEFYSNVPVIEASDDGLYELTITNSMGCTASNIQFVNIAAVSSPTVILQNDVLTSSTALNYQWYISDQPIEGATNQSYQPTQNGVYSVVVTNIFGCTGGSVPFELTTVSTNTPESLSDVQLFPNPVTSVLHLKVNADVSQDFYLELYTANGKLVLRKEFEAHTSLSASVDMDGYAAGIYIVKLTNADGNLVRKIFNQ